MELVNKKKKQPAFTLAEALLTIIIIGVVAALSAPSLIKNYQDRSYDATQKTFLTNIRSAMRNMQVADKLSGYSTTMDFVNELKNYLKITKICDSSHLSDCFASEIKESESEKPLSIDKFKTSKNLGKEYSDNNVGIITINGITAIVTYNPECKVSGMNFQDVNSLACIGIMYDLNGLKKPNSASKDIKFLNAGYSDWCLGMELDGKCFMTDDAFLTSFMAKYDSSGYKAEYTSTCDNGGRMATADELKAIAPLIKSKSSGSGSSRPSGSGSGSIQKANYCIPDARISVGGRGYSSVEVIDSNGNQTYVTLGFIHTSAPYSNVCQTICVK